MKSLNQNKPVPSDPTDADEPDVTVRGFHRNWALLTLVALAGIFALRWAQEVFIPVLMGVLISYALDPVVSRLQRWGIHRAIGSAIVLVAVAAAMGFGAYSVTDDVIAVVEDLPEAAQKLRAALRGTRGDPSVVEKVQKAADELEATAAEAAGPAQQTGGVTPVRIQEKTLDLQGVVIWGSLGVLGFVSQVVLLLFLVFFLLSSGDLFRRKIIKIAGSTFARRKITVEILNDINAQIGRFVVVQVITSALVAAASTVAFMLIGLERAPLWGIAAGLFNIIPYFGPLLVSGGVAVVGFLQFGTISMSVYIAAITLAITTLEGYLLTPWLTGHAVRMNGVAVFIGLLFWGWMWGMWGLLLTVPMMVIVKSICDRVEDLQPISELLKE